MSPPPCRGGGQLFGRAGSCEFLQHRPAPRPRPPVHEGCVSLHLQRVAESLHRPQLHERGADSAEVPSPSCRRVTELFNSCMFLDFGEESSKCLDVLSPASIKVRQAAAQCIKNILATPSGVQFWEEHKDSKDTMLAYLHPFRQAKKQVCQGLFLTGSTAAISSPVDLMTSLLLGPGSECRRELGGAFEAGESRLLDSCGGRPQALAEGPLRRPAGQWRSQE